MLSHISPDSPNDGLTNGKINGHLKPGNPGNGPSSMEVFQSLVVITGINQWGSSKYHPHGRDLSCQHLGHEHLHPFTMYISMLKPSFWSLKGIKIIIIHHISRRPSYSSPRSLTSIHLPELHPLTHCKGSNPHHLMDGRWLKKSDWLHGPVKGWGTLVSTIKYQKVYANVLVMQFFHESDGYDWGSHQQKPPEKITSLPEPGHPIFWYRNWMFFSQPNEPINKHHHGIHEYGHSKSTSNKKG